MTETSFPFDTTAMNEDMWAQMARYWMPTGVMAIPQDVVNQLAVTTTGGANRQVLIDSGSAWIQGFFYLNDGSPQLALNPGVNTSQSGTRADLLVLELKWGTGAEITAKVMPGTAGAVYPAGNGSLSGTPIPPTPIQEYQQKWQIPLACITIPYNASTLTSANIRDMRYFVNGGAAKSSTYVIAADTASPLIRANADAVIPAGYTHAEDIINAGLVAISPGGSYGGLTRGNGTVLLSEGDFYTNGAINLPGSTNLRGLGWGTRIYSAGGANPVILLNGVSWCGVTDMLIDGGGTPPNRGAFPAVVTGSNAITANDGILHTFRNLYISNCKNDGIFLNSVSGGIYSYGHRIEGCYVSGACNAGIVTSSSQGIITNNQIRYNKIGMQLVGATGSIGASANTINNNQISYNWWDGMQLSSSAAGSLTVYRNNIENNHFNSNSIDADNAHSHIAMWGQLTQGNFITGNNFWTENGVNYKPGYGIYMDNLVNVNIITNNEAWYSARNTANNIKCLYPGGSNMNPNRIRWNQSQCVAPNGSSYDA
jgi:hypothetical protein